MTREEIEDIVSEICDADVDLITEGEHILAMRIRIGDEVLEITGLGHPIGFILDNQLVFFDGEED